MRQFLETQPGLRQALNIDELAELQHGLISRWQLREFHIPRTTVDGRIRVGRWKILDNGVYIVTGAPVTPLSEIMAKVLAGGSSAFASHWTAAWLHEFIPKLSREKAIIPPTPHEITTDIVRQVRIPGVRAHRSYTLHELDVTEIYGIPVVGPARTIVDLSGRLFKENLETLVDEALRKRIVSLNALVACAGRLHRAPGRNPEKVQDLLLTRIPGLNLSESALEDRVHRWISKTKLPSPVPQYQVEINSQKYRIDLAYPKQRIAIELDGFDFHRTKTDFERDESRATALALDGWQVLRFTAKSEEQYVLKTITQALGLCNLQ